MDAATLAEVQLQHPPCILTHEERIEAALRATERRGLLRSMWWRKWVY